jgi:hypothetical protein
MGMILDWLSTLIGIKLNDPHEVPFAGHLMFGALLAFTLGFIINWSLDRSMAGKERESEHKGIE